MLSSSHTQKVTSYTPLRRTLEQLKYSTTLPNLGTRKLDESNDLTETQRHTFQMNVDLRRRLLRHDLH